MLAVRAVASQQAVTIRGAAHVGVATTRTGASGRCRVLRVSDGEMARRRAGEEEREGKKGEVFH